MSSIFTMLGSLLRNLTRKGQVEQDLAEELEGYVDLLTEKKVQQGWSPAGARRAALLELGGIEQVKEQTRSARLGYLLESCGRDVRFALRTLRKAPAFSTTVVLVLALGLGSAGLVFSIVDAMLLRSAPFPRADRLYLLWQDLPQEQRVAFSTREFTTWASENQSFESLAAAAEASYVLTGRGEPEVLKAQRVTPSLFQVLRTLPALGRTFLAEEGEPGKGNVAIVSYHLWKEKFAARRDVIGANIRLDNEQYTIVGVLPKSFDFPNRDVQLWVPAALAGPPFQKYPDAHFLRVIGRLKDGVTPERLRAENAVLGTRTNAPGDDTARRFYGVALDEMRAADWRRPLLVLFGAVGFLLLIACANVANLMLARGNAREEEMAVRRALGASRGRLVAQLLTEAMLLVALGAVAGIGLAVWGLALLQRLYATNFPELLSAAIDGRTIAFAVGGSVLCGLLMGLGPALAATRRKPGLTLKGAARATSNAESERARQLLIFTEVLLASVLLVGCGLRLRSFINLSHVHPGFRAENLLTANISLGKKQYPEGADLLRFYQASLAKVEAIQGVEAAGVATQLPFSGNSWGNSCEVEGHPNPPGVQLSAQIRPVDPGYLATMGIPLLQGRQFTAHDKAGTPGVAIVNRRFAQRFWPNESPLGKRVRYVSEWLSIVGVCGDIKHRELEADADAEIYVPIPQVLPDVLTLVGRSLNFVARTSAPNVVAPQLRGALQALDPSLVVEVKPMESLIRDSIAQPRFRTWMIGIVSMFALGLAGIGIYGVIAYLVTQRAKEIGIRIALGATRKDILRLVIGRIFGLTCAGLAMGMILSLILSRFLSSLLFGVTTHDALTFICVPLSLLGLTLAAAYLPARGALAVDPVSAMRCP